MERAASDFPLPDFWAILTTPPVWVRLTLTTPYGEADVECRGSTWRNRSEQLTVQRMDPDPEPWLRTFLTTAGRTLYSHGAGIPTPDVAWKVARLRLIFGQRDGVTEAVRQGLDHMRGAGTADLDVEDLRLLHLQLSRCDCRSAASLLSAYLDTVRS